MTAPVLPFLDTVPLEAQVVHMYTVTTVVLPVNARMHRGRHGSVTHALSVITGLPKRLQLSRLSLHTAQPLQERKALPPRCCTLFHHLHYHESYCILNV